LKRRGWLIAIEGIDAAGKLTQSRLLSSWLQRKKWSTITLSFPDYTTPIGKEIKAFLTGRRQYSVELKHILFAANRWERLEQLNNYLKAGNVLIINRYTESNLAYGVANGLSLRWLTLLERGLPRSDLVILLDAPSQVFRSRRQTSRDTYEADYSLQEKASAAYRRLASRYRWAVVDAAADVESVHRHITALVSRKLSMEH
jgi:dTMP kinase